MEHSDAINVIVGYVFNESTHREQLEAAAQHVSACPGCLDQLDAALGLIEGQPYGLGAVLAEIGLPLPHAPAFAEYVRQQRSSAGGVWQAAEKTRSLLHVVEILLSQQGTRLGELATALQPFLLAPVPMRGKQEMRPEGLALEDPESDVRITLRLSRQNQLLINLSSIVSSSPKRGRISLMTTGEPKRTLQRLTITPGERASLLLSRGDLVIQIEHDSQVWEIPIRVS